MQKTPIRLFPHIQLFLDTPGRTIVPGYSRIFLDLPGRTEDLFLDQEKRRRKSSKFGIVGLVLLVYCFYIFNAVYGINGAQ